MDSHNERQVVWIGHSTLLIAVDGITILTDPIFSIRTSTFSFVGPKRIVQHAIQIENLSDINEIIISHNHYDHLDLESLKKMNKLQPNMKYFVPLGLESLLSNVGIKKIQELD